MGWMARSGDILYYLTCVHELQRCFVRKKDSPAELAAQQQLENINIKEYIYDEQSSAVSHACAKFRLSPGSILAICQGFGQFQLLTQIQRQPDWIDLEVAFYIDLPTKKQTLARHMVFYLSKLLGAPANATPYKTGTMESPRWRITVTGLQCVQVLVGLMLRCCQAESGMPRHPGCDLAAKMVMEMQRGWLGSAAMEKVLELYEQAGCPWNLDGRTMQSVYKYLELRRRGALMRRYGEPFLGGGLGLGWGGGAKLGMVVVVWLGVEMYQKNFVGGKIVVGGKVPLRTTYLLVNIIVHNSNRKVNNNQ